MERGSLVAFLLVLLSLFVSMDPFNLRPIAEFPDFVAAPLEVRPFSLNRFFPRDHDNKLRASKILFSNQLAGPESLTFDSQGRGPYTGIADGRILHWDGSSWSEFATVYPPGSENCKPQSPPVPNLAHEHLCGRPLGVRFMESTGELYIADAYFGLLVVGPDGGQAQPLVNEAENSTFAFTNDLVISPDDIIYFTVTSDLYPRRKFLLTALAGDPTGRLLSYNPKTKVVKVLYRGLRSPNGITINQDGSFLVFSETAYCRLNRYWLRGPKAGTMEIFAELPGYPDNVRTNKDGQFWVAIYCRQSLSAWVLSKYAWLRRILVQLPLSLNHLNKVFLGTQPHALAVLINQEGEIVEILEDETGENVKFISEVEERDGELWMGSVLMPHIAVYTRSSVVDAQIVE